MPAPRPAAGRAGRGCPACSARWASGVGVGGGCQRIGGARERPPAPGLRGFPGSACQRGRATRRAVGAGPAPATGPAGPVWPHFPARPHPPDSDRARGAPLPARDCSAGVSALPSAGGPVRRGPWMGKGRRGPRTPHAPRGRHLWPPGAQRARQGPSPAPRPRDPVPEPGPRLHSCRSWAEPALGAVNARTMGVRVEEPGAAGSEPRAAPPSGPRPRRLPSPGCEAESALE